MLRSITLAISLGSVMLLSSLASAKSRSEKIDFDTDKAGEKPSQWEGGFYGDKGQPKWTVEADASASSRPNVLRKSGNAVYSYLVLPAVTTRDGHVECRFRIESGKEDPEAGLVLRFKDGKNYLYVRANSLEKNIAFYRMNAGKKELVKTVDAPVVVGKWQKLRVDFKGDGYKVFFEDRELLSLGDAVITSAGAVGVWTTADTAVSFDDFEVEIP